MCYSRIKVCLTTLQEEMAQCLHHLHYALLLEGYFECTSQCLLRFIMIRIMWLNESEVHLNVCVIRLSPQ